MYKLENNIYIEGYDKGKSNITFWEWIPFCFEVGTFNEYKFAVTETNIFTFFKIFIPKMNMVMADQSQVTNGNHETQMQI